MDALSTVVITSLTTLLVAVVAAAVAARFQSRREQANWLRDRRHQVCVTMLKSIDWRDLAQKVDAKRPKALPAPADLYAELDVLGMDGVTGAAKLSTDALFAIEIAFQGDREFNSDVYDRLQAKFDQTRLEYVEEVRRALGIKAI